MTEGKWELTNELRFVPRLDGDRWTRVLQQKWVGLVYEAITEEWRDVPFDQDGE